MRGSGREWEWGDGGGGGDGMGVCIHDLGVFIGTIVW
jgi:hypothetical protein